MSSAANVASTAAQVHQVSNQVTTGNNNNSKSSNKKDNNIGISMNNKGNDSNINGNTNPFGNFGLNSNDGKNGGLLSLVTAIDQDSARSSNSQK